MKRILRKNVFETNSSSVHSLVISDAGMEEPKLKTIEKDGEKYILVSLNSFDNSEKTYTSQDDKLSYILTLIYILTCGVDAEDLKNKYAYQILEGRILHYCHKFNLDIYGIYVDNFKNAYIDHQTLNKYYGNYFDEYDFTDHMGVDYITFVFNKYVFLHTDSD